MLRSASLPDLSRLTPVRAGPLSIDAPDLKPAPKPDTRREWLLEPRADLRDYPDIESPITRSKAFAATRRELHALFNRISHEPIRGRNADYIAALADRDPTKFGVSVVTSDGGQLSFGDAGATFTIQSLSKPLDHLMALRDTGSAVVDRHVACRPSAFAFNAASSVGVADTLDPTPRNARTLMALKTPETCSALRDRLKLHGDSRPVNASCNFGALATTQLVGGNLLLNHPQTLQQHSNPQAARTLALFERMAGRSHAGAGAGAGNTCGARREVELPCASPDPRVFTSELSDSAGNQVLAKLVITENRRRSGMSSPDALNHPALPRQAFHLVETYTANCAISTHVAALAAAYATLSGEGVNPFSDRRIIDADHAAMALEQMRVGGLYEATVAFTARTGFICKSGVGGGVVAIDTITGLTFAVYSTPLDLHGNSVRGLEYLERLAASPAYRTLRQECLARQLPC